MNLIPMVFQRLDCIGWQQEAIRGIVELSGIVPPATGET